MSAIILESSLVHYEALGRGKPLLFLHDWLGSWRYWVPTMIELSSSYKAYAIDFWGYGDSDKVNARYSLQGYVDQVSLFMNQMGIVSVPIIGHGLGGLVAARFAEKYPDMVEQVTMVNAPLSPDDIGRPLSGFTGGDNPAARILGRRLNAYQEVALEANKTDWHAVVSSLASVMEDDFIDTLEDMLDIPVMLVYGGQNNLVQPPSDDDLDYMGNNINAFVLDEAQHYPMLEETSKFNRLLLDFLLKKDNWDEIKVKGQWRRRVR